MIWIWVVKSGFKPPKGTTIFYSLGVNHLNFSVVQISYLLTAQNLGFLYQGALVHWPLLFY